MGYEEDNYKRNIKLFKKFKPTLIQRLVLWWVNIGADRSDCELEHANDALTSYSMTENDFLTAYYARKIIDKRKRMRERVHRGFEEEVSDMNEVKIIDIKNIDNGTGLKSLIHFENYNKKYSCKILFDEEEDRNIVHIDISLPDLFTLRNRKEVMPFAKDYNNYKYLIPECQYHLESHFKLREENHFIFITWLGKPLFNRNEIERDISENIIVNESNLVTETYKERCPCTGCNNMVTYHKGQSRVPMTAKICNGCAKKGERHSRQVSEVIENSTGGIEGAIAAVEAKFGK